MIIWQRTKEKCSKIYNRHLEKEYYEKTPLDTLLFIFIDVPLFFKAIIMALNENREEAELKNSIKELNKARFRKEREKLLRKWVEENEKIHLLNYWYYRYFTRDFERFLIRKLLEEKDNVKRLKKANSNLNDKLVRDITNNSVERHEMIKDIARKVIWEISKDEGGHILHYNEWLDNNYENLLKEFNQSYRKENDREEEEM